MPTEWRRCGLKLVLCSLLVLALLLQSWGFQHAQRARFDAHQSEVGALREEILGLRQAGDTIATLQPRLLAMAARGVLVAETRLPWLEVLHDAGQRLHLPSLRWRLEPAQLFHPAGFPAVPGIEAQATELKVEVDLARIAQLPALLDLLADPHHGLVTVRSCQLEALGKAGFHARCTFARLTLKPAAPPA